MGSSPKKRKPDIADEYFATDGNADPTLFGPFECESAFDAGGDLNPHVALARE
jgi:hypothetical protein